MASGHQQEYFTFDECEVVNIAGKRSTIPAGRHPCAEQSSGVRVSVLPGTEVDLPFAEWDRLKKQNLVRE